MGIRRWLRWGRLIEDHVRRWIGWHDSEHKRMKDAQAFWDRPLNDQNASWYHLRESALFVGDGESNWAAIGQRHLDLFQSIARTVDFSLPIQKIIEWGCGGGANAVRFAPLCQEFFGVDVSEAVLKECQAQLEQSGNSSVFHPVKIQIPDPESALNLLPRNADLFYSMYVFELFPSINYCQRVLSIARTVLRPGGVAYIQIKYATRDRRTHPRHWGYRRGVANMCSFELDAFWRLCESCGFTPHTIQLVPRPVEVPDERYAYFLMTR
jgi:SAM-dependent methyltransferase